jgi:hypothetical protein
LPVRAKRKGPRTEGPVAKAIRQLKPGGFFRLPPGFKKPDAVVRSAAKRLKIGAMPYRTPAGEWICWLPKPGVRPPEEA